MVVMKCAAAAALFLIGAAGETSRTPELEKELDDLRKELTELRGVVAHEQQERRLASSTYVTQEVFNVQVATLNNKTAAINASALQAATDLKLGDGELAMALDSAWLLLCGTLVMFMHAGFAMLETGCCRAKNASNVLMKNLVNVSVGTIAWYFLGWGLAYGSTDNTFIGTKQFAAGGFLGTSEGGAIEPYTPDDDGLPTQSLMLGWYFQWAFCTAAATIVSGGVAERVKSPTYACYAFVMASFIYPLVVKWTWGYGWLAELGGIGYMDFAGSGVVHLTGGVSALAGTVVLGPRKGRFENPDEFGAHSMPLVVLGTLALWFGWYGFNCGSTLSMHSASTGAMAAQVAMNTTLAAATGGIVVFILRYQITKLYDVGGLCNGILAGLVSITAPCGNIESFSAIVVGLIGACIYQGASMLLVRLKIDDPVDASPVHGACGIWGALAAGIFDWGAGLDHFHGWSGFSCLTDDDGNCQTGIGGKAIGIQIAMVLSIIAWAGTLSGLTFFLLNKTGMLRIDDETEIAGMDQKHHSPAKAYSIDQQPTKEVTV